MLSRTDIKAVLNRDEEDIVLDVRTPAEFVRGHIPGAKNLPLFTNRERAQIGTAYKQQGPHKAMQMGLRMIGPRMDILAAAGQELISDNKAFIHCWRGGKRSASVGWLLALAGCDIRVLDGGYKSYRRAVHNAMNEQYPLIVLGGYTGSGKTEILHRLAAMGEQVLDLEGLAHHKGSAFGWIDEQKQPGTEQFENELFERVRTFDLNRRIWVENESRHIGKIYLPDPFWRLMKSSPLIHLDVPVQARIDRLMHMYAGTAHKTDLIASFQKIERRIGGQNLNKAIQAIEQGDLSMAAEIALGYYDKTYAYNLEKNISPHILRLSLDGHGDHRVQEVLKFADQNVHLKLHRERHQTHSI